MKLIDWATKNPVHHNPKTGNIAYKHPIDDNLHVIGTCGECGYWEDFKGGWCVKRGGRWDKDDGSIHFEREE